MDHLETELFEAASKGCISSLQKLLKDDPLILDRVVVNCFYETPLHVAAMLGHIEFVLEITRIKPELTNELNSQLSSPLHLASGKGNVDVVKALLSIDRRTCLARYRNGLTPLHLAVVKGRVEVVMVLLQAQPDAARLTVYRGENILHLCVKHYQVEALKLLVKTIDDPEFINAKDNDGNTILHLAVADKQVETIEFLLSVAALKVNALNLEGMTAVDVLIRSRRDVRDALIKESLKHARGFGTLETNISPHMDQNMAAQTLSSRHDQPTSATDKSLKQKRKWVEQKKNALMVVASLIATMAFQVGVNPPRGVWQDDRLPDDSPGSPVPSHHQAGSSIFAYKLPDDSPESPVPNYHEAGFSILADKSPEDFGKYYLINTTGFIASLSIILLLMSGLPIRRRFFMWILMVITWIAITAVAYIYVRSIILLSNTKYKYVDERVYKVIDVSMEVWSCLMALLLIGHAIRLIVKVVKKLMKALKKLMKLLRRMFATSAVLENNGAV